MTATSLQKKKIPRKQISIRWKLVSYLAVFVSVLLLFLWLFQTVFLEDVYRNIKESEVRVAAETLRRYLTETEGKTSGLGTLDDELSKSNQICISVLDASFHSVSSIDGERDVCYSWGTFGSCFVHQEGSLPFSSAILRMNFLTAVRQAGQIYFSEVDPDAERIANGDQDAFGPVRTPASERETAMLYVEYLELDGGGFYIILNSKVTPVDATAETLRYELIIISILFIASAVIMGIVLSRNISAPIIAINHSARDLAKGDFGTRFEGDGYAEIAELCNTLNYASTELSKIEGFRRELIANVSHDLRTPLTMITGYAEVMRDLPGENTPENVQIIVDEGNRLTTLVNDLLDLSKLQSGADTLSVSVFSLTECVRNINQRYKKLTENDGYEITFDYACDVYVKGDYSKLGQVIYNLINNAISYTGEDKRVIISQTVTEASEGTPERVRISVRDTGAGISKENLEYIWDRYFKENKTHKRAVIGTGLGLSIVKGVLELHGASFGVETSEEADDHGSTFWFEMETAVQ